MSKESEYWKDFPEAPASSTFKWLDTDGFEHMTTFRAYSGSTLMGVVDKFIAEIKDKGGKPLNAKPAGDGSWDDSKSFKVTRINLEVSKGKAYHKVAGVEGKFPKWPVTIWPEVLEKAGIDWEDIPTEGLAFEGTARYVVNDAGNPAKVIELIAE